MSQEPTPLQALILWALLARGGTSFQKDLKPKVEPKDRDCLVRARLISVEKKNRSIVLHVEEAGWGWATKNMNAELSTRSTAGGFVLRDLLARLDAFMRTNDKALADILVARAPSKAREDFPPEIHTELPTAPTDLRERIRAAFLKITGGRFNTRVRLSELRALLPDLDRTTQDKAIFTVAHEKDADLLQLDNRIDITDADREAALQVGKEPRHLLWISK